MNDSEFEEFLKIEFLGEAEELIEDSIRHIENEATKESLDRLFRNMHTIKGSGKAAGFAYICEFAHLLEDVLMDLPEDLEFFADQKELIQDSVYFMSDMIEAYKQDFNREFKNPVLEERLRRATTPLPQDSFISPSPLAKKAPPEPKKPVQKVTLASSGQDEKLHDEIRQKQRTILVIDDQRHNQRILRSYLSKFNFKVIIESRAISGLGQFVLEKPNLIITDIVMPELNGIDFIKAIRKIDKTVPIITISGSSEVQSGPNNFKGPVEHLVKPFELDALLHKIKKCMNYRQSNVQVLVIDDEENIRSLLKEELENANFSVITASDGKEAFRKSKGLEISCIITDLKMNGMNGYDFLIAAADSMFKDVPKIVLSGAIEKFPSYATTVLEKPWDSDELVSIVKKLTAIGSIPLTKKIKNGENGTRR